MKRFVETTIWTQNKWFRKLEIKYKLFWFYLLSNCDPVGVWEEDIELASFIIGCDFDIEDTFKVFNGKVRKINVKKWWVVDFCDFQYGELKEENINNRPHQSYISLLKKHSLWIDYKKIMQRPKEKDKEQEKDKEKDKGIDTFEIARKAYPGTKRKVETEYENFKKKHKDYKEALPLLLPAIENQIAWRNNGNGFKPDWKMFQTWINNRSWEDEVSGASQTVIKAY